MHAAHEQASKALAVLLTHISNSHTALAQQAAQQSSSNASANASVAARPQMASSSLHAHASIADTNSRVCDPVDQQHADSQKQDSADAEAFADAATAVKLCAFQQELVQRIMQANNSIMFLPSGIRTVLEHSCLLTQHSQATYCVHTANAIYKQYCMSLNCASDQHCSLFRCLRPKGVTVPFITICVVL